MRWTRPIFIITIALIAMGCAHQINISPPLNSLDGNNVSRIEKVVGYYIPASDLDREVATPGGGGDKVKYFPYPGIGAGAPTGAVERL